MTTTRARVKTSTKTTAKQELIGLLNHALELEHAARIQYLSHAELIDGLNAEPLMARLRHNAEDESRHEAKFRTLIGDYLNGEPTMRIAETHPAHSIEEILQTNLNDERHAVDVYTDIQSRINQFRGELPYEFFQLEHEVRHILMEEQEHMAELRILLSQK